MFESIRKNTRILAILLGILVIPAFVLVGVSGYTSNSDRSEAVAEVGTSVITKEQWDRAHDAEIQRVQRSVPDVDVKLLDSPAARYATLQRLVQELVLTTARDEQMLTVSDSRLANALMQQPVIASLRDENGRLDQQRYRDLLAAQGYTPESYEAALRASLSTDLVTSFVANTGLAHAGTEGPILDAFFQRRTIALKTYQPADFKAQQAVSDEQVKAYYSENPQQFQAPEVVDVEYVVLDQAKVAESISVDETELNSYYEQNRSRFATPERRRVRHILIEAGADDAAQAAAKQRAEAIREQLAAAPQRFVELAKSESQDPGSAEQGGDLGWVERGAMVKPFEDSAFALKPLEVSDVVQTEFGWHVIQVTEVEASVSQPFAEVREQILADVRQGQARLKYAEMAEKFSNRVYEEARSFEGVASELGVKIQVARDVTRAGVEGVLSNAKVLRAIFDAESISGQRNIDAVEVDGKQLVSARVTRHDPAHTRAFEEVAVDAKSLLVAQLSAEAAWKAGNDALQAARSGATLEGVDTVVVVSRDVAPTLPAAVVRAVMAMQADQLPAWTGVNLGDAGYSLVRLDRVDPRPSVDATRLSQESQQLRRAYGEAEVNAFVEYLREHFKTKILVPDPGLGAEG